MSSHSPTTLSIREGVKTPPRQGLDYQATSRLTRRRRHWLHGATRTRGCTQPHIFPHTPSGDHHTALQGGSGWSSTWPLHGTTPIRVAMLWPGSRSQEEQPVADDPSPLRTIRPEHQRPHCKGHLLTPLRHCRRRRPDARPSGTWSADGQG